MEILDAIKDVINYYERAIECKQENPVLFALQMALKVEENRIKSKQNVVPCGTCKWWLESERYKGYGYCGLTNGIIRAFDWYCADGTSIEEDMKCEN